MKLTCAQMEILISFYLENELSPCLREQFEEHLKECSTCSSKFEMIKTMFSEMRNQTCSSDFDDDFEENSYGTKIHENVFSTKLSEYIDNELSGNENIKIKKFTITNPKARKELEDSYNIRRLMSDSYKKTKSEAKQDFTKSILRQLELEEAVQSGFHPAISLLVIFTITVLIGTTIVLLYLNS